MRWRPAWEERPRSRTAWPTEPSSAGVASGPGAALGSRPWPGGSRRPWVPGLPRLRPRAIGRDPRGAGGPLGRAGGRRPGTPRPVRAGPHRARPRTVGPPGLFLTGGCASAQCVTMAPTRPARPAGACRSSFARSPPPSGAARRGRVALPRIALDQAPPSAEPALRPTALAARPAARAEARPGPTLKSERLAHGPWSRAPRGSASSVVIWSTRSARRRRASATLPVSARWIV